MAAAFTVALLGDPGTGKADLVRIAGQVLVGAPTPWKISRIVPITGTNVTMKVHRIELLPDVSCTSGLDETRRRLELFRHCDGAIVLYNTSKASTFSSVKRYLEELLAVGNSRCATFVVGCRDATARAVDIDAAKEFSRCLSAGWAELDITDVKAVDDLMLSLAQLLLGKFGEDGGSSSAGSTPGGSSAIPPLAVSSMPTSGRTKPPTQRPHWIEDELVAACMRCQRVFTATKRRHHCRACGNIFCKKCTVFINLPNLKYSSAQRACIRCEKVYKMSYEPQPEPSSGLLSPRRAVAKITRQMAL